MLFSWSVFITSASLLIVYAGFFLIVVPQMERVFADFKARVPLLTTAVLAIGHWMNPWGAMGLILVPPALAVLVPLAVPSPTVDEPLADVRSARRWALLIRLFLLLLLGLMAAAMFMPLVSIIDGITTQRH